MGQVELRQVLLKDLTGEEGAEELEESPTMQPYFRLARIRQNGSNMARML